MRSDETAKAGGVAALRERLDDLEAEVALLRAEIAAGRIDRGEEITIPAKVVRRVFVEDVPPIRAFREWRGLTQEELARRVGSSKGYISQMETRRRNPGARMLRKLAEALRVPADMLME